MIPNDASNPFRPGLGQIPPAFPGRVKEQSELNRLINDLKRHLVPARDIIICAPRGNGKTALLAWFNEAVMNQAAADINIIHLTPDDIPTTQALIDIISLPDNEAGLFGRIEGSIKAKIPAVLTGMPADASIQAKLSPQRQEATHTVTTQALIDRCRKKPTVLILDEARNLPEQVGQTLLNASQNAKKKVPFLLIMAGTPGLRNHLDTMSATFWERNNVMQPGLLSFADTREAIVTPLETYQVTFNHKTLETIIDDSQGYPYFTQLWGEKLFNNLQTQQASHVEDTVMSLALEDIEAQRQIFYRGRYDRLNKRQLIPAATQLAKYFEHQSVLDEGKIEEILGKSKLPVDRTPEAVRDELSDEGYIWLANPSEQYDFYAGIPSLMRHIKKRAQYISSQEDGIDAR